MGEERVVLGFFGSRHFDGDGFYGLIAEEVAKHKPQYIVTSGETEGISMLARRYARKEGMPLKLHFLNRVYGRGQYNQRSRGITEEATHLIIIHDGLSTGTANELALVKKLKKPYTYHLIQRGDHPTELSRPIPEATDAE